MSHNTFMSSLTQFSPKASKLFSSNHHWPLCLFLQLVCLFECTLWMWSDPQFSAPHRITLVFVFANSVSLSLIMILGIQYLDMILDLRNLMIWKFVVVVNAFASTDFENSLWWWLWHFFESLTLVGFPLGPRHTLGLGINFLGGCTILWWIFLLGSWTCTNIDASLFMTGQ